MYIYIHIYIAVFVLFYLRIFQGGTASVRVCLVFLLELFKSLSNQDSVPPIVKHDTLRLLHV